MKVNIPSPLRSYTGNKSSVEIRGSSIEELLKNLDKGYPGIRFRMIDERDQIREHIRIFINENQVKALGEKVSDRDVIHIICALSGG